MLKQKLFNFVKLESEEKIEPLAKIIELKESTPQKNIFSNGKNNSASDETTNQDERTQTNHE